MGKLPIFLIFLYLKCSWSVYLEFVVRVFFWNVFGVCVWSGYLEWVFGGCNALERQGENPAAGLTFLYPVRLYLFNPTDHLTVQSRREAHGKCQHSSWTFRYIHDVSFSSLDIFYKRIVYG